MWPEAEHEPRSTSVEAFPILRSGPGRGVRCGARKPIWESVRERVRELWRHSEIGSFSRFAQACEVNLERLEEILENEEIDEETAERLARTFNVEYEWVRLGKGPFQKQRADAECRVEFDREAAADSVSDHFRQCNPATHYEFIHVRKANATVGPRGETFLEETFACERYAFSADWIRSIGAIPDRVVLLDVEGDSMTPVLRKGDTVLIDLNRTRFKEGGLFALEIGEALLVKQLQIITGRMGPQIRVISVNPWYQTWECGPEDIRILGEVLWIGRTLP